MFELGDCAVYAAPGNHAQPDEPVRIDRAILLGQEIVVAVHHSSVRVVVDDVVCHVDTAAREQDLGVYSVLVLLLDPLLGRPRSGHVLVADEVVQAPAFGRRAGVMVCALVRWSVFY